MSLKPIGVYILITNPDILALREKKTDSGLILTGALVETNDRLTKTRIAKVIAIGTGIHEGNFVVDLNEELKVGDYVMIKPFTAKEIVKDREKGLSVLIAHFDEVLVKLEDYEDPAIEEQFRIAKENGY